MGVGGGKAAPNPHLYPLAREETDWQSKLNRTQNKNPPAPLGRGGDLSHVVPPKFGDGFAPPPHS